jgi:lipopolysaccharide transport system permease protein
MLSARFRDIPPIIGSLLQVGFLLTPVFWPIEALGDWVPMAAFNPNFCGNRCRARAAPRDSDWS